MQRGLFADEKLGEECQQGLIAIAHRTVNE